jgi:hypothetical protein
MSLATVLNAAAAAAGSRVIVTSRSAQGFPTELDDGDAELGAEMLGAYRSFTEARRPERSGCRIPPDEAAAQALARAASERPDAWARGRLKTIGDFASSLYDLRLVGA